MTIEAVLYARLSTFAGLAALIGNRAYPNVAPQGVSVPFLTWRWVSDVGYPAMGQDSGLTSARIQVDVIAASYLSMRAVSRQVRAALNRWRDPDADPPVIDCFRDTVLERAEDLGDAVLHLASLDFMLHYRE